MNHQRHNGVIFSALLHFVWLVFAIFGLPLLASKAPPPEPVAISVELLPITEMSNIKPSESQPTPQPKDDKKADQSKKPTPPVKTNDSAPPPPPKPSDVTKPQEKKPDEKKPEDKKKPDKKQKPEDLAAVLKAVKDTAKNQKPDDKKTADDSSKSKTKSDNYNPSLPMSMSEKDAIKNQFAACWRPPVGAKDAYNLQIMVELEIGQDGTVIKADLDSASKSKANSDGFFRAAADSALRAVHECSPLKNLPPEKYDTWHYMELNFDPKEMLF